MPTILIAEDDAKTRDLFAGYLKMKGYQVHEAKNGEDAVSAVRRQSYDLILMDVKMPRLDGLAALRQIRTLSPAKVLLITGFVADSGVDEMITPGVVECVRKPLTFERLSQAIDRLTGSADRRRPPAAPAG
jgi:CheY-like chemotaxis protein